MVVFFCFFYYNNKRTKKQGAQSENCRKHPAAVCGTPLEPASELSIPPRDGTDLRLCDQPQSAPPVRSPAVAGGGRRELPQSLRLEHRHGGLHAQRRIRARHPAPPARGRRRHSGGDGVRLPSAERHSPLRHRARPQRIYRARHHPPRWKKLLRQLLARPIHTGGLRSVALSAGIPRRAGTGTPERAGTPARRRALL